MKVGDVVRLVKWDDEGFSPDLSSGERIVPGDVGVVHDIYPTIVKYQIDVRFFRNPSRCYSMARSELEVIE